MFFLVVCLCLISIAQSQPSICDKYSSALSVSNLQLVTLIVTDTEGALLGNSTTLPYFDGTRPLGSTAFNNPQNSAKLTALTTSLVQFFGGALGCTDGTIPPYTGPTMVQVHQKMGVDTKAFDTFNELLIKVTASKGVSAADNTAILGVLQSTKATIVFPPSICDKYSAALKISNFDLVKTVVAGTEGKLLVDPITLIYFTGVKPAGSTDFTNAANAAKLTALTASLINFFGAALGCTDGTIPAYTGPSMKQVHANMQVDAQAFDAFNKNLLEVTAGAGVDQADNNAILGVLETTRADIVTIGVPPSGTTPGVSICDKYSAALSLSNNALVSVVVSDTVGGLVANQITLPYFNGKFPSGTTDFLDPGNAALLTNLQAHLVQFFGGALACTDGTITPYTGPSMLAVHSRMQVSAAAFDSFNSILLNVLASKGVSPEDVNTVAVVLEGQRGDVVAGSADAYRPNFLSSGTVAGIIIGAIIAAALMGALCVGLVFIEGSLPKFH